MKRGLLDTSSIKEKPEFIFSTIFLFISTPKTLYPELAAATAKGSPTYPKPTIAIFFVKVYPSLT
jgi:hypothetical protein